MYRWSEMDLAVQGAIRQFVDTEIGPHREELEFEQLARDAKSLMIYAGSNELQITQVAKGVLAR